MKANFTSVTSIHIWKSDLLKQLKLLLCNKTFLNIYQLKTYRSLIHKLPGWFVILEKIKASFKHSYWKQSVFYTAQHSEEVPCSPTPCTGLPVIQACTHHMGGMKLQVPLKWHQIITQDMLMLQILTSKSKLKELQLYTSIKMSTTRAHTASCHLLKSGQFDTRQRKSTSLVSVKTSNPNSDLDLKQLTI